MHELSLCSNLVAQLQQLADGYPQLRLVEVHLTVGPLAGVEPALLQHAFPVAAAGTVAAEATLRMTVGTVQIFCPRCQRQSEASANNLSCRYCHEWQTQLVSGDELILQRVEFEE
ncbi:MAG: hydrogenase maturation nickel metallochaperone HypA [Gammaproteobacteria bacterium]|nr:hydrogenase maturation nickel metallochaperone HypA [Gammaproteobacteria bacterium]